MTTIERTEKIKESFQKGVARALSQHKVKGNPIAVWRDGKIEHIPAEEIQT
jgi:hypothetical protein